MPEPSPVLVDTIAAAIADSDEYHGYWDHLTDTISNPSPGLDTRPLEACRAMYQREARAALAAMPKPIAHGILMHRYAPEAAWILGPYDRTEAERLGAREPDLGLGTSTVVALVPVEDQ